MWGPSYDLALKPLEYLWLRALRAKLLAHARGKTLEVGVGTGLNLPHYPPGTVVIAIDPDASMRHRALMRLGLRARLEEGDAENLAFNDGEFDTVVATLVLCSVSSPETALKEIYRVLKPGGRLLLLEHVRPPQALLGRLSDALTPAWKLISGGCHLNCNPQPLVKALGFQIIKSETFWNGIGRLWVLEKPVG